MTARTLLLLGALCGGCIFTSRPMPPPDEETDAGGTMVFHDVAAAADAVGPGADATVAFDAPVYDLPTQFDVSAPDATPASDVAASDSRTSEHCDDKSDGGARDGASHDRTAPCDDAGGAGDAGDADDAGDVGDARDAAVDAGETGDSL